jgi:hypothetical protein
MRILGIRERCESDTCGHSVLQLELTVGTVLVLHVCHCVVQARLSAGQEQFVVVGFRRVANENILFHQCP